MSQDQNYPFDWYRSGGGTADRRLGWHKANNGFILDADLVNNSFLSKIHLNLEHVMTNCYQFLIYSSNVNVRLDLFDDTRNHMIFSDTMET